MQLHPLDWLVILLYLAFALWIGVRFAGRASQSVDEFFLSGRRLPWWIAGTSMVATTFAADTPLVVSGWVRDFGIWQNWLWWCYAIGGLFTAFLFARYWRRLGVMTTAELAEARYGGRDAAALRGFLGFFHAGVTNINVLSWVLLAGVKITDVLFGIDPVPAVVAICLFSLVYSLLGGFWGVVITDVVQFIMAMTGAIALAIIAWSEVGGAAGIEAAVTSGVIDPARLDFIPAVGSGGIFDGSFWSASFAAFAVYLGVSWWATDSVDGGSYIVQRISACKDERHGVLAQLWYNVAHHALRPWPWIVVALASLVLLPHAELTTPVAGQVTAIVAEEGRVEITAEGQTMVIAPEGDDAWHPQKALVEIGDQVLVGDRVMATDSERAYPMMMVRYLPFGLLGLVLASLLAALMSTIDTHVILASSYFINDVYRRFLVKGASTRHYVLAARVSGVVVMALAGAVAVVADSIADLFTFFLAFLGGVGPVYIMRWIWWRVRAQTEIAAMLASSASTLLLTFQWEWFSPVIRLGSLTPDGELSAPGRIAIVALVSLITALVVTFASRRPDPRDLVTFYRRVRPAGLWGPVRALCPEIRTNRELPLAITGTIAALTVVYSTLFLIGDLILGRSSLSHAVPLAIGLVVAVWSLHRLDATATSLFDDEPTKENLA